MASRTSHEVQEHVTRWNHEGQPENPKGPYADMVDVVIDFFDKNKASLIHTLMGNEEVEMTPPASFNYLDGSPSENGLTRTASTFFFRNKNGASSLIFFMIDPKDDPDKRYRLSLDKDSGIVLDVDLKDNFKDRSLVLGAIDSTEVILNELSYQRRKKMKRVKHLIGSVSVGIAFATAASFTGMWVKDKSDATLAYKRELRQKYDRAGHQLPHQPIALPALHRQTNISVIPEEEFMKIPKFHENDNLQDPRVITVYANQCTTYKTRLDKEAKIDIADADPLTAPLMVGRDSQGDLVVCSSTDFIYDADAWTMAVQVEE